MVKTKKIKIEKPLTDVELELMNVIWDLGECTVKDVQGALPEERQLAYTSVATMMKILEQKGALKSTKQDRAHTYQPIISRSEYEALSLRHLTENVFRGDSTTMVMRLIDDSDLSEEELQNIRKLINERLKS